MYGISISLIIAVGLNLLLFIPAFIFKTDKVTDLSYAISFIVVSLFLFFNSTGVAAHLVLLLMIVLWAVRLGSYLFIRIRKMDRDKRFDGMRESFSRFLRFWTFQGLTVFAVLLSSIPFFSLSNPKITMWSIVGIGVWLIGLVIESVADMQKYTFINNPANKGLWIDSGLWHYSRHPNYFGEILLWIGVYIFALSGISGVDVLIGLLSPMYIATIILFFSGIPLLEKAADKRWGDNEKYKVYKKTTSPLFLLPKKKR